MKKRHISLADIHLPKNVLTRVSSVIRSNRLTYGPKTKQFETKFAAINSVTHAIFCNSGTSALQLALAALKLTRGWKDGDEVLVPAVTFIASSNAVIHTNLTPVFVDIEPDFYCIDPQEIEKHITSRTRAIMPVHLFGQSADMNPIRRVAKRHTLAIIEDAAEALFSTYHNRPVGSLSDISIFSTYAAHTITTGVGGFVLTSNPELAHVARSMSYHGRDTVYHSIDDDNTTNPVKLLSLIERRFHFPYMGFSFRLTELESTIGLAQLSQSKRIISARHKTDTLLRAALAPFADHIQLPAIRPHTDPTFMLYPLILKNPAIDLDLFLLFLERHGIETRLFFPLLQQPIYKKLFGDIENRYPVAKRLTARGFMIGCHPELSRLDIHYIQHIFALFFHKLV